MAFREKRGSQDPFEQLVVNCPTNKTLERLDRLVDQAVIRRILARGYDRSGTVNPGFDLVVLARMLTPESLYNLSGVKAAEVCADRPFLPQVPRPRALRQDVRRHYAGEVSKAHGAGASAMRIYA